MVGWHHRLDGHDFERTLGDGEHSEQQCMSGLPGGLDGKESACSTGDLGSVSALEGCPGGGNAKPVQYSCPENPRDRGTRMDMNLYLNKQMIRFG